jgi:hypothetical protein
VLEKNLSIQADSFRKRDFIAHEQRQMCGIWREQKFH